MYIRARRYAKRMHLKKNEDWRKKRYFGRFYLERNDKWIFGDFQSGIHLLKFTWFKIKRHVLGWRFQVQKNGYIRKRAYKVFNRESKQNRYTSKKLLRQAFPAVPYSENKFVQVKGEKSPYDGDLIYSSKRNSKLYDGETSKALKRQNHSCAACKLKFTVKQRVHLHHVDGNHNNWSYDNFVAIHESCHDYTHMSKNKN